jgi:hypothetical protein
MKASFEPSLFIKGLVVPLTQCSSFLKVFGKSFLSAEQFSEGLRVF